MNLIKLTAIFFAFTAALTAQAQNRGGSDIGSAFVNGDTLYVTILGDCNSINGNLQVEPLCSSDRLTMNFATECSAELLLFSTKRSCPANTKRPRVLQISLNESKVTREAEVLNLKIQDHMFQVRIK